MARADIEETGHGAPRASVVREAYPVRDPSGGGYSIVTAYEYDTEDRLTKMWDPNRTTTELVGTISIGWPAVKGGWFPYTLREAENFTGIVLNPDVGSS